MPLPSDSNSTRKFKEIKNTAHLESKIKVCFTQHSGSPALLLVGAMREFVHLVVEITTDS